jgi:hypothetical protein
MSESFYPSISSLLKTDNIPEFLSFIKDALNDAGNALYYKNLQFNGQIICQGFAFEDASCYPSSEHVNGEALDTNYLSTTQRNVDFILALYNFGFNLFRIGNTSHSVSNNIYNDALLAQIREASPQIIVRDVANSTLHSSHLHSTKVIIKNGEKTL